jgi:NADH dehydrogenase FAD-containing subunit
MTRQVVILGGSYAAIVSLKSVLTTKTEKLEVVIVSPSEYAWNNTTVPRLLVETTKKEKTIVSFKRIIEKNSKNSIHKTKLIKGKAVSVDLENKTVGLSTGESLNYTQLIIATGERSDTPVFRSIHDHVQQFTQLDQLSENIKSSSSIAIVGGGATGVEVAGELGFAYGKDKDIVIYTGKGLLRTLSASSQAAAQNKLEKLNIKVVNLRVADITGKRITFEDGTNKTFDLIIPAFKSFPNSEFLPKAILDASGHVKTDEHFRVNGYADVIAVGDISSITVKSLFDIYYIQSKVIKNTIEHMLTKTGSVERKLYSAPTNPTMLVPISRNGGVGVVYGWNFPSFLVKIAKAKDFGIPRSELLLS